MSNSRKLSFLACAAFLSSASASFAAPFTNGSFETYTGTGPGQFATEFTPSTNITGWSITSGSMDVIGTYWAAADGSISLDTSGNDPGTIQQTFDTTIGQQYTVTFSLAANPDATPDVKTLDVSATGTPSQSYSFDRTGHTKATAAAMGWVDDIYTFTASSPSTTLSFASTTAGSGGAALDNVRVSATPEPTALALLSLGGLSLCRRRRACR